MLTGRLAAPEGPLGSTRPSATAGAAEGGDQVGGLGKEKAMGLFCTLSYGLDPLVSVRG